MEGWIQEEPECPSLSLQSSQAYMNYIIYVWIANPCVNMQDVPYIL
jgi:hypothetical protein